MSRRRKLRRWLEMSPAARSLTSRFIAGVTLTDALQTAEALRARDVRATLAHLGENVAAVAGARVARDAYLAALEGIAAANLECSVSAKLTALGLDISEEECLENASILAARAASLSRVVEFDMESSAYTERTLAVVHELHRRHRSVRAVIQAYLYRSRDDVRRLCGAGIPIRLCKGAYREPAGIAWQTTAQVDASYRSLVRVLFDQGVYPAYATHDATLVDEIIGLAKERGLDAGSFEFQMLYGVRRELQNQVAARGYRLRLYVPYGAAWYPYFMRRLAEKPSNAWLIFRSFLE